MLKYLGDETSVRAARHRRNRMSERKCIGFRERGGYVVGWLGQGEAGESKG